MCENCPMLTGNIAKGSSSLFIVNFKYISNIVLVS